MPTTPALQPGQQSETLSQKINKTYCLHARIYSSVEMEDKPYLKQTSWFFTINWLSEWTFVAGSIFVGNSVYLAVLWTNFHVEYNVYKA